MKKIILLFCLLIPLVTFSQQRLEKLVDERKQLHEQWKDSETKKSGIFGHRTKKDMIETNNWLERIVKKDNQIIDELELLKSIETTEITYEKEDYKFIAQKQELDIGKLKRALAEKDEKIAEEKSNKRTYEWTTLIFFISTLTLGYLFYKTKFKA
ncbi:Clp protease ClpB [Echinicola jeungdonensis]|uniref:Clp protease ClpB n=1 Tax=Echinicola jeungdonensis TaxID=709343 RepID=A0ABV5J6J5_9BACT|nr:Clp protease ClpB [Echinicola jeungdonensis]MDN3668624.1 Clp protease ClpB [Echinicola jeungdonensis]